MSYFREVTVMRRINVQNEKGGIVYSERQH